MSAPVHPGVGATFYGNLPRDLETPLGREVIAACDHVTLHTAADATDVASAARVRTLGCPRVWLAIPANYLSKLALAKGVSEAVREAERASRVALDLGAEVFELNGEGASDGAKAGDWTSAPGDAREARRLGDLAVATLEAARAVLGDRCALAFTSHDMPGFRLPWREILTRVDLHAPQHYPAQAGRTVSQRELEGRVERARGRWESYCERDGVHDDVAPWGGRWSPYYQGHGHTVGALVWGLSTAPVARLWACPGSWSPEAVKALHAARALRAVVAPCPEAVKLYQAHHGLEADGIIGRATLARLEVV